MNYNSTRNKKVSVSASEAIASGISKDGGLFVPNSFPRYNYETLCKLKNLDYKGRAKKIIGDFLAEFTLEQVNKCVEKAYTNEKFDGYNPTPLVLLQNGNINMYVMELWHGPTCAFKDMALQILPHLLSESLKNISSEKTAVILVATSGDTGKAALEGFKDVDSVEILVFYPELGVSDMQKRQMTTQDGNNVYVCAVNGNFDDAQTAIKNIFTDKECIEKLSNKNMIFSSANSINWGRLLPQIVYYFSAYCDLMSTGEIDYDGEKINIVVPTGNFGNILAAYYAMKMGLPVNKLICASNSNNVLTDFINTGIYDRNRKFLQTISPSMDILISSNLERLLYDLTDYNDNIINDWMNQLKNVGKYEVDFHTKEKLREIFYAGFCNDNNAKSTIKEMFETENYLCDTHTAVAINVYKQYVNATEDIETPTVIASTASPYKFSKSVLSAIAEINEGSKQDFDFVDELSSITGTKIPNPIENIRRKKSRFNDVCSKSSIKDTILRVLDINK